MVLGQNVQMLEIATVPDDVHENRPTQLVVCGHKSTAVRRVTDSYGR